MNHVAVLMPNAERVKGSERQLAPRIDLFRGKTIGIINNSWRCMNVVSETLRASLTELGVARIIEKRISAAERLHEADMNELAEECDAAIVGIGN
ncbi:MAG: hypothetical protein QOE50_1155 [Sphingomonadales bacterium]|nr:hypothetical protein [Sphingomonadales bacterium]